LSYHKTNKDSIAEELRLQKKHNVVNNIKYFNEAYATVNGSHGRDVSGKYNPNFGVKWNEEQKKHLSNMSLGCKCYNNGKVTINVYRNQDIPNGYVKGSLSKPVKDKIWINNGIKETYYSGTKIPDGYTKGRLNKSVSGKFKINNGLKSKYLKIGTEIPDGWVKGSIKVKCEVCGNLTDKGNYALRHGIKCMVKKETKTG